MASFCKTTRETLKYAEIRLLMKYENIRRGVFLKRPNRFCAVCLIEKETVEAHVKNTGRCGEILIPGTVIFLQESNDPKRRTRFSLIAAVKNDRIINIDSQAPNKAALEAMKTGVVKPFGEFQLIKPEYTYGNSRFDFYAQTTAGKAFIEVKGVTLEKNGKALFPDAPTSRGLKHLLELGKAMTEGYLACVLFVIQMKNVRSFSPSYETHPEFGLALRSMENKGAVILAYDCAVTKNSMEIKDSVDVIL